MSAIFSYQAVAEAALARYSIPSPWMLGLTDTITVTAGGLSLLCLILFAFRNRENKASADRPARFFIRKAKKADKKGNYAEAGALYASAKRFKESAAAFVKVGEYEKAAESCVAMSDYGNAAECLVRVGAHGQAAEFFARTKNFIQAAENLVKVDRFHEAALFFEKGGDSLHASEFFSRTGHHQKAGELLAEAGKHSRAAPLLVRALQERVSHRDPSVAPEEDRVSKNLAALASLSLLQANQRGKAAKVLETGGHFKQAARLYEELGKGRKASELYMRAKDAASAARILGSSDTPEEGGLDVASALLEEGKTMEAGELFGRIGEWRKAAEVFVAAGDREKAVEAFEKAGDYRLAADILIELGRSSDAAHLLLAGGRPEDAAVIFRDLGETEQEASALFDAGAFFQAARFFISLGKEERATDALQKVENSSPDYTEANRLLGDLFFGQRMWSLAIAAYQNAIANETPRRDNLDSFYRYAASLKEDDQLHGAVSILEKILLVDYHYRDVKDQLTSMKALLGASSPGQGRIVADKFPLDSTMVSGGPGPSAKDGRYEIIEEVGRGGMGVVYKARDTLLDRVVAYKVLPPQVQRNQRVLEMFLREAKSAARLSHPNIVVIYDADQRRGEYYIVMEFVDGDSLKEILEKQGMFELKPALVIAGQVLRALAYAHSKDIVHRDIKPANLLWSRDEKLVKITDFGLARAVAEGRKTHTQMAGTPFYMSPEQILGGEIDHRADLYAVGVTIYEFLTGTVPFKEGDVMYHHVHTAPPPPEKFNPSIPPALSRFILKCMEKNVDKRFHDAEAALTELRTLVK
ncbi:serine/threonine-protein kinase PrkC [bacterium BMS3Abin14]|nr:serine/threonine-protein kinase PrkC [bacterium BMS3Abin14]